MSQDSDEVPVEMNGLIQHQEHSLVNLHSCLRCVHRDQHVAHEASDVTEDPDRLLSGRDILPVDWRMETWENGSMGEWKHGRMKT